MFIKHILNKAGLPVVSAWINNKYLKQLGTMTNLQLDPTKQQISLALDLHGEKTPIELTIDYQILSPTRIEIKHVLSSRDWIATLANEMVPAEKKRIEVPSAVTAALQLIK